MTLLLPCLGTILDSSCPASCQPSSSPPPSSGSIVAAWSHLSRRSMTAHALFCAVASFLQELPFVLLGLRAQPREDTGLSPAEAVFGAPIVLTNECLPNKELSVDSIIKNFSKTLDDPASSLPRHNSRFQLSSKLPAELLSTPLIWVHRGGVDPPLQPLYDSPCAVLCRSPVPSPSESGHGMRSCLSATSRPAQQRTPSLAAHVAAADRHLFPGGPATTKRVSYSDPLVSSPSILSLPRDGPGTVGGVDIAKSDSLV